MVAPFRFSWQSALALPSSAAGAMKNSANDIDNSPSNEYNVTMVMTMVIILEDRYD
jgi:hypothetical protein